ncbi:MAG TPA: aminopeptidase [Longimicrobiaceae bacterium]|nr:aminopeptidase [Longimicrobiaceae bacterium]
MISRKHAVRVLAPVLAALLAACSPLYVIRAGYEEAKILARRKPIRELVENPRIPPERRAKLSLVLQARNFAERTLELKAGESYTTFSQLDSDTLALVLSAAYQDRFQPHTWWFPIVGHVPYKGFFSEAAARREMRRLEERGLDTYLRPTAAFSTLGWFNDPLVSPVLRYGDVDLVNTVIHEIFHNTLYLAGEAQYNESLANFVGARGAIEFFCRRDGPAAPTCREAEGAWQDDLVFGAFLDGLVAELERLYARTDLSREAKLAARETVFRGARERFAGEIRPRLRVQSFASFLTTPLNNATLISRRLYYHRLELFERVFQERGRDLPRTIREIVRAARGAEDPYAATERLLHTP